MILLLISIVIIDVLPQKNMRLFVHERGKTSFRGQIKPLFEGLTMADEYPTLAKKTASANGYVTRFN